MPTIIPKIKKDGEEEHKIREIGFLPAMDRQKPLKVTSGGVLVEADEEEIKSNWYCFITSLDREQDINLIKELLFWGRIYHDDDANIEILIPGWAGKRYDYYRRVFQINEVPCLILTDNDEYPVDFILISKNLINTEYLGENFVNLREMLDFLHNTLMNEGNLKKIKMELLKTKFETILGKTWNEIKSLISLNIG